MTMLRLAPFLALIAASCAAAPVPLPGGPATGETDRLEAIYRYQMARNSSGLQNRAQAFCLDRLMPGGRTDPPPELIARLAADDPRVRPASHCIVAGDNEGNIVKDRQTGAQGLILRVGEIRCQSAVRCIAEGGYYEANVSASTNDYVLELQNGKWTVVSDTMRSIS